MAWEKIRFNGEDSDGCIFTVMTGLSSIGAKPKEAFEEFCKAHLASYGGWNAPLYSHYVFSGPTNGGNHGKTDYVTPFAQFIRDNKLGELVCPKEPVENKKHHPGRLGTVYVWVPNRDAVLKWAKDNMGDGKTNKVPAGRGAY